MAVGRQVRESLLLVAAALALLGAATALQPCDSVGSQGKGLSTQACGQTRHLGRAVASGLLQGPRRMLLQEAQAPPQPSHDGNAPAAPLKKAPGKPGLNHGGLAEALIAQRQHKRVEDAVAAAEAPAPNDGLPHYSHKDLCSDHPPPGNYGCDEQRDFDKCWADFMVAGDFCKRTCGRCQGVCNDIPPPGPYSCAQQKEYGKCDEHYVRDWGYCAAICGRCDMSVADTAPQAKAPTAASSSEAMPTAAPTAESTETPTLEPMAVPTAGPTAAPTAADDPAVLAALAKQQQEEKQQAAPTPAPKASSHHKHHKTTHVVKHAGDNDGDDGAAHAAGHTHSGDGDGDDGTAHVDAAGNTVVVHKHSIFAYVHGILMVAAFGVILPLGIFTSRYGKFWSGWFNTHRALQTIGWAVAAAGFVLALAMHKLAHWMEQAHAAGQPTGRRLLHDEAVLHDAAWQKRHKVYLLHKYLGIAIFVVVSLQVSSLFKRPDKKSKLRAAWAWAHWLGGWGALVAALFNNFEGLYLIQPLDTWWTIGYGILVAAIAGVVLVAEARRCIYGHELEGYKQAGEDGGLELVGGSREEREGLTASGATGANGSGGGRFDLQDDDDDEELAFATSKFAKD